MAADALSRLRGSGNTPTVKKEVSDHNEQDMRQFLDRELKRHWK